ncbi:MAG: hypothetical protein ACK53Y_06535, partial [bacterium]
PTYPPAAHACIIVCVRCSCPKCKIYHGATYEDARRPVGKRLGTGGGMREREREPPERDSGSSSQI